jgi:DNA-binding transcriptional ArsR family regulator
MMAMTAALDHDQRAELAETFHLLGDANRLALVLACLDRPVNVGDMARQLDLSPSLVSHHLRLLRAARVLKRERRGKQAYYNLDDAHVREMLTNMIAHLAEDRRDSSA